MKAQCPAKCGRELGNESPKRRRRGHPPVKYPMTITVDALRAMYVDQQLNQREIGDAVGVPQSVVSRWLRKAGIPTRTAGQSHKILMRTRRATWPTGSKQCCCCEEIKSFEAFGYSRSRPDGRSERCRSCQMIAASASRRKVGTSYWRLLRKDPNYYRRYRILAKYGMTIEQYDELLEQQGGVCAICRQQQANGKDLVVDHCHEIGIVRGLLCTRCNVRLGVLDNAEWCEQALAYTTRVYQALAPNAQAQLDDATERAIAYLSDFNRQKVAT